MGVIAAMALGALVAGQAAGGGLTPTTAWTVGDNQGDCALFRTFGSGSGPVDLGLKPDVSGRGGEVTLAIGGAREERGRSGVGRIVVEPSGAAFATTWASFFVPDRALRGVRIAVGDGFWAALDQGPTLAIDIGARGPVRLPVGAMAGARAALDACRTGKLKEWGADPAAMAPSPSPAQVAAWFPASAYPKRAWKNGIAGRTVMLLELDGGGVPVACRTVRSAGDRGLDDATCALARERVRFAADARPTRWAVVPVRWSIASNW